MLDPQENADDILQILENKKRRRRSRSPIKKAWRQVNKVVSLRALLVGVLAVFIVLTVGTVGLVTDANNRVNASLDSLDRVTKQLRDEPGTNLTYTDFERLQAAVNELSRNLALAQRQTIPLRPLRWANADLAASLDGLAASHSLSLAAVDMLSGLQPTLFFMGTGRDREQLSLQITSGQRIIELLRIGQARFITAQQHLGEAERVLQNMDVAALSPEMLLKVDDLQAYHQQLVDINGLLLTAPELLTQALGSDQTQTYLVLAQNSDELRPAGGYIGTYGWVRLRDGRIESYNYSPTTATSPAPPGRDFAVAVPDWWINYQRPAFAAWDGSWHTDFPATASLAAGYYNAGANPFTPVNGVFAIDIYGFEYLLGALGSVRVPDYDVVVTSANFRDVVYNIREYGGTEDLHKQFLAALYQQIFSDWQTLRHDGTRYQDIVSATLRALREKHIMLYFADEQLNHALDVLGWAGRQAVATDHDYLMVVDANLGNKSNRSIQRQVTYDVSIQPGGLLSSQATVHYDYPAFVAESDPAVNAQFHGPLDYNNLLQVFIPTDSLYLGADNVTDVQSVEIDGRQALIARVGVPYDTSRRYQFAYEPPALIENIGLNRRYRLLLQKQPGTPAEVVNVQVRLPAGASLTSTNPPASASYNIDRTIVEFLLELATDTWIEVTYQE